MNKTVNAFDRKLLQICFNTGVVVANGRLCNDKDGNFTFYTAQGRSVNDYLLVPPSEYRLINDFKVLPINEFSDHMPVYFELDLSVISGRLYW